MLSFYVINLDRSPDRMDWMHQRACELSINMQRIQAVDGRNLSSAEIDRWTRCRHPRFGIGPNEIACFLSHRLAWHKIVEAGEPWAFIAEDDIHFDHRCLPFLSGSSWIPLDADVVKAETVNQRVWLSPRISSQYANHQLLEIKSTHAGAAGYFICPKTAQTLLDVSNGMCISPDQVVFNKTFEPGRSFKIYQILPALVAQDWVVAPMAERTRFKSLLLDERNQYHCSRQARHQSLTGLTWYKLTNPLKKCSRRTIESLAKLIGTHRVEKIAFERPAQVSYQSEAV